MEEKKLDIFNEGIKFHYWGELYLGCKAKWITPHDVLSFCKKNKISKSNDTRYTSLYLALNCSLFDFYEEIKSFIIEDKDTLIVKNEDEIYDFFFDYIPHEYFRIWELNFLLQVRNNSLPVIKKMEEVSFLFDAINYPNKWLPFYLYQTNSNSEDIYSKFNVHLP